MIKTVEKKSNKKAVNNKVHNKKNDNTMFFQRFRVVLLALLGVILFYPPYLRGLYFENEQLPTEIFIFIIYIAFLIYKYLKQDKKFIHTPLEYVSFGFVIVYFLSIFNAVGTREAIGEWLKYCMFFAVFIMLSELINTYKSKMFSLWTLVASATGVSIIGIDGVAGGIIAAKLNMLFKALGADGEVFFGVFVGNRINSTFQYPNATAAYLMAIFFIAITLILISKKLYIKLICGIASYIILTTFILTLSRGAMIFLPVAGIAFIIMQVSGKKIRSILSMLPGVGGFLFTFPKLSNYMANPEGNGLNVWTYLFIGIFITLFVQIIIEFLFHYTSKFIQKDTNIYNKIKFIGIILSSIFLILIIIISVIAVTTKETLILSHDSGQADSNISVRRSFILEPDNEYKLVYKVKSENVMDKPNTYTISVASRDFAGVINNVDSPLVNIQGMTTNGIEEREVQFKVPANSRAVSITFSNFYEGTKVKLREAKLEPIGHNDKMRNIALKYKYIPESIYSRVDDAKETKSGIERTIFARDGFEIFKENIILGGGGGSWPLQYFAHQSYLYWTTQAHNYPIQVAVETGVLGIIVLIAFYASVLLQIILLVKNRNTSDKQAGIIKAGVLAAALGLIMHSTMDFDLSLSAIYLLLWELLAILNTKTIDERINNEEKATNKIIRYTSEVKQLNISPLISIILSAVIIIFPIMFLRGLNYSIKATALQNKLNITEAFKYMENAVRADSFSTKYKAEYLNLFLQQDPKMFTDRNIKKADLYASDIEKAANNNVDIATKLGNYYLSTANIEKGKYYFDRATELRPLRPQEWQLKADAYYKFGMYLKSNGDTQNADKYFKEVLDLPEETKKVSQASKIPFTMTPTTMEIIEKVNLLMDKSIKISESLSSRTVFYALNDIDIDGNGIPDEWNETKDLKLQVSENKITVEADAGKQGILQSRKIVFKPEKSYVLSLELENVKDITGDIMVNLSGHQNPIKLTKIGNIYAAEISTITGGDIEPISIGLVVNGKYVIKDVRVVEKE